MSLSALNVALQGLFSLTPIALAVQGLIEEIQEEKRQQTYGGKRKGRAAPTYSAEDIERLVRDKWEAIEQAQDTKATPKVAVATPVVAPPIQPSEPTQKAQSSQSPIGPLAMKAVASAGVVGRPAAQIDPAAATVEAVASNDDDEALIAILGVASMAD